MLACFSSPAGHPRLGAVPECKRAIRTFMIEVKSRSANGQDTCNTAAAHGAGPSKHPSALVRAQEIPIAAVLLPQQRTHHLTYVREPPRPKAPLRPCRCLN